MGYYILSGQECGYIPWSATSDEQAILSLSTTLDPDKLGSGFKHFTC
jgi:hypothetical protein